MKLEQHWRFSFPLRSKESDQAVCRCAQKENPGLVRKINSGCTVFLCKAVNTLRRTLLRPWSVVQEFWGLHRHWLWLALRHQASQGSREGGGKQRRKTASGGGGGKFTVRLKQNRSVGWKITIKKKSENAALKLHSRLLFLLPAKYKWIMWSYLFCDLRLCRWSQELRSPLTASHYIVWL